MLFRKGRISNINLILIVILSQLHCYACISAYKADHVHHNRHSSLEFGVEPNAQEQAVQNDDHFTPVGTPKVNFTCTITRPHIRYTVKLVKEQTIPDEGTSRKDVVITGDFVLNPELGNLDRFALYDEEASGSYRVIFQLTNLQPSDSGRYICVYHNLQKSINLHVYEQLNSKDTSLAVIESKTSNVLDFNDGHIDLKLKEAYKFVCNVNELYPKPKVTFSVNDETYTSQIEDNSENVKKNNFYAVKSSVTADFTVEKELNNKKFKCVISPEVPSLAPVVKSLLLHVRGVEFYDGGCIDKITARNGDKSIEVSCKFYSYPKPNVKWTAAAETETNEEKKTSNEDANAIASENENENVAETETESSENKAYRELENSDDAPYTISFEAIESESEPDTYVAVFVIKEYNSDKDLKDLAINIDNGESSLKRVFRFGIHPAKAGDTDAVVGGAVSSLKQLKSIHSIILSIFISCYYFK